MLRTNSKKARENMREHVLECCEVYLDGFGPDEKDMTKPVTSMWEIIKKELGWMRGGHYAIFREHVMGLGFGDFWHCRKVLQAVLEETDEEAAKFSEEKCESVYLCLLERHFFELLWKERNRD